MNQLIAGCIEVLDQLKAFVSSVSEQHYCVEAQPVFDSSIGQHVRHVCDMYQTLIDSLESGHIDYNMRTRGSELESNNRIALEKINNIKQWLLSLSNNVLDKSLIIITEETVDSKNSVEINSNVERELSATSSHLIHHLAYMASIARYLGCEVDSTIGMAPATMTHVRETALLETNKCAP